jgi:hypothetical protein
LRKNKKQGARHLHKIIAGQLRVDFVDMYAVAYLCEHREEADHHTLFFNFIHIKEQIND